MIFLNFFELLCHSQGQISTMIHEKRLVEFDSHPELMLKDIHDSFLNFDRHISSFYGQKLDILEKSKII